METVKESDEEERHMYGVHKVYMNKKRQKEPNSVIVEEGVDLSTLGIKFNDKNKEYLSSYLKT